MSNRLSKVQADNQIRFQDLETASLSENNFNKNKDKKSDEILPGSSQPQDLGSVSYKDTSTNEISQKTQSIDTTATIVTENFVTDEKILPKVHQKINMNLQLVF